ncbi:MAG: heme-binding protein [Rhodospirillales bacterium]|nr:heme-binding protein [Rhodospirillales bacterium]
MRTIVTLAASVLIVGCSVVGDHGDLETPPYEVMARLTDEAEVRRYGNRLAVQAVVPGGDSEGARNTAFRLLFDYITGANEGETGIAMTVPVETVSEPTGIAMTAPVETGIEENGSMTMRFFLPARYNAQNAPRPTDDRVSIVTLPGQTMAVLTFSGSRSEAAIDRREVELLALLEVRGMTTTGETVSYFYDPPWTLPWFRRNEVAVEISPPVS